MDTYDPLKAPNPEEWLSLDEGERLLLAEEHHRQARVKLPNEQLHAVAHVIVENQVALGDEIATRATLERLMREGLDRHEAIHAIGSVLFGVIHDQSRGDAAERDIEEDLNDELGKLTASAWLESFE